MTWSGIFTTEEDFDRFIINLTLARKNQIWLSGELIEKLTQLNVFLINLQNVNNPKKEEDYNFIGNKYFEKVRKFRKEIECIYKNDFKSLYKIDDFLNKKSSKKNTYEIRVKEF